MIVTFRLRRDTAANWTSVNPVLALAEPGWERDTGKLKLGDGTTAWNGLGYFTSSITSGQITTALGYTPTSVTGLTGIQSVAAFKTGLSLVKADVGLGNVDNTSDAAKPVSTATQTALDLKAALASPPLTGTPTAPTQPAADSSTKIATTAYARNDAEAAMLASPIIAAFATPPTAARRALILDCTARLLSAGVWDKLALFYLTAAADAGAAVVNWIKPGTNNLVPTNTPTFVADRGYSGDGVSQYLDTACTINTLRNVTLNSLAFGTYENTNIADGARPISNAAGTTIRLNSRSVTDTMQGRANDNSALSTSSITTSVGLSMVNRSGAAARQLYKNGASIASDAGASTSLATDSMYLLRSGTLYSTTRVAAAVVGGSLNATEHAALYTAVNAYLTAVGGA